MDAAAQALGIDRVELRRRNALLPGSVDLKTGVPLENIRIREALDRGRELFRWDELRREDAAFNASNGRYRRGVGVGCGGHGSTYFPRHDDFGEGWIAMNEDGTVRLKITTHDHGCGTVTMLKMVVAEVLDISDEDICLTEGDTANTPIDFGCFASRTTFVLGRTAVETAQALKQILLERAALLFDQPLEQLYVENGAVRRRDSPDLSWTYAEIAGQSVLRLTCGGGHLDRLYQNFGLSRRSGHRPAYQSRYVHRSDSGCGPDGVRSRPAGGAGDSEGRPVYQQPVQVPPVSGSGFTQHPGGAAHRRPLV